MVVPFIEIFTMFFLAISIPFLMAAGTSFAFPEPKPTRPAPSPTTTRALKLKFLPPLTTLVTRLIWTTLSIIPLSLLSSRSRRSPRGEPCPGRFIGRCNRGLLEFQTVFARRVSERFDVAVIKVSAAVEDHTRDALVLRALGDQRADRFRSRRVGTLGARVRIFRRSGGQRLAGRVVDDLDVDVFLTLEDRHARTLLRAGELAADPFPNPASRCDSLFCVIHGYFPAALPALRRITSSVYLMPLPLYGSGSRSERISAAVCPTSCLSLPVTVT